MTGRRVGVALGGGGAWAYAHCAFLQSLHDADIPVDIVAGTSFGSMVGAFYASQGLEGLRKLVAAGPTLSYIAMACPITTWPAAWFAAPNITTKKLQALDLPILAL